MTDPEFVRKARITDILSRAWDVLRDAGAGSGDPILDLALVSFAAYVAQDPRAISDLSAKPDFHAILDAMMRRDRALEPFQFLDEDHSVDDAKRAGIGKAERKLVSGSLTPTSDFTYALTVFGFSAPVHSFKRWIACCLILALREKDLIMSVQLTEGRNDLGLTNPFALR